MVEMKTQQNDASVDDFIAGIADERQRQDAQTLLGLIRSVTGEEPRMWGESIVGFDKILYKSRSQPAYDWFSVGFSPRKGKTTLYLNGDLSQLDDQFARLGKFKRGVGCVWIKRLADVDLNVLQEMIEQVVTRNRQTGMLVA